MEKEKCIVPSVVSLHVQTVNEGDQESIRSLITTSEQSMPSRKWSYSLVRIYNTGYSKRRSNHPGSSHLISYSDSPSLPPYLPLRHHNHHHSNNKSYPHISSAVINSRFTAALNQKQKNDTKYSLPPPPTQSTSSSSHLWSNSSSSSTYKTNKKATYHSSLDWDNIHNNNSNNTQHRLTSTSSTIMQPFPSKLISPNKLKNGENINCSITTTSNGSTTTLVTINTTTAISSNKGLSKKSSDDSLSEIPQIIKQPPSNITEKNTTQHSYQIPQAIPEETPPLKQLSVLTKDLTTPDLLRNQELSTQHQQHQQQISSHPPRPKSTSNIPNNNDESKRLNNSDLSNDDSSNKRIQRSKSTMVTRSSNYSNNRLTTSCNINRTSINIETKTAPPQNKMSPKLSYKEKRNYPYPDPVGDGLNVWEPFNERLSEMQSYVLDTVKWEKARFGMRSRRQPPRLVVPSTISNEPF